MVLARTSVPPCFSVMPMPKVIARFSDAKGRNEDRRRARAPGAARRRQAPAPGAAWRWRRSSSSRGSSDRPPSGPPYRGRRRGPRWRRGAAARPLREVLPSRGVQPLRAARLHAPVVGGMVVNAVEAAALAVVRPEPRRVLVGEPPALECLCAAALRPKRDERVGRPPRRPRAPRPFRAASEV